MNRVRIINDSQIEGVSFESSTSKVVCVGRNYTEHAKELNNPIPSKPILFNKTNNSLVLLDGKIAIPSGLGECHHELEVAILINKTLKNVNEETAIESIDAVGIGIDLTLRELQSKLKQKGQPWERAKSFDGACPVTDFIKLDEILDSEEIGSQSSANISKDERNQLKKEYLSNIEFTLTKNDKIVQKGHTANMIFSIPFLLSHISKTFTLFPGDIVLTGTPAGVGQLNSGDRLSVTLNNRILASSLVL